MPARGGGILWSDAALNHADQPRCRSPAAPQPSPEPAPVRDPGEDPAAHVLGRRDLHDARVRRRARPRGRRPCRACPPARRAGRSAAARAAGATSRRRAVSPAATTTSIGKPRRAGRSPNVSRFVDWMPAIRAAASPVGAISSARSAGAPGRRRLERRERHGRGIRQRLRTALPLVQRRQERRAGRAAGPSRATSASSLEEGQLDRRSRPPPSSHAISGSWMRMSTVPPAGTIVRSCRPRASRPRRTGDR